MRIQIEIKDPKRVEELQKEGYTLVKFNPPTMEKETNAAEDILNSLPWRTFDKSGRQGNWIFATTKEGALIPQLADGELSLLYNRLLKGAHAVIGDWSYAVSANGKFLNRFPVRPK
jgi:hypothetical protein